MSCFEAGVAALRGRGLTGEGVRVGLLDTGLDPAASGGRPVAFRRVSEDGFVLKTAAARDTGQHGTAMARSLREMAPGVALLAAEVIERGDIAARVLTGLDWLARAGAEVICLPLGLPPPSPSLDAFAAALGARGVLVVAASGNGGAGRVLAPATSPWVLAAGALDEADRVAAYSGSAEVAGRIVPRLALPALAQGGTSGAAARLAGLVALLRQTGAGVGEIAAALEATARPIDGQGHRVRAGAVEPEAAWHALGRVRVEALNDEPVAGGVAQRLAARLRHPAETVAAILTFRDHTALARALGGATGLRMRRYRVAPVALVAGRASEVARLCAAPGLPAAETTDADQSEYAFVGVPRVRPPLQG